MQGTIISTRKKEIDSLVSIAGRALVAGLTSDVRIKLRDWSNKYGGLIVEEQDNRRYFYSKDANGNKQILLYRTICNVQSKR